MPLIQRWDPTTRRRVASVPVAKVPIKYKGKYQSAKLRYCECGALLGYKRYYCDDCQVVKNKEAKKKWRDTKRPSQAKPKDQHKPHHSSTKTHCPYDHPYDEENTYYTKKGHRGCRKCRAKREREWREKNRGKR